MDIETGLDRLVNPIQKQQKFLMSMARLALADHGSLQNVQGREQCSRSVTLVIVCLSLRQIRPQRQYWLRAIQCLNLAVFAHAQPHGVSGGFSRAHQCRVPSEQSQDHC